MPGGIYCGVNLAPDTSLQWGSRVLAPFVPLYRPRVLCHLFFFDHACFLPPFYSVSSVSFHAFPSNQPCLPFRPSIHRVYFRTFPSTGSTFLLCDQPCLSPTFPPTILPFPPSPQPSLLPRHFSTSHLYFPFFPFHQNHIYFSAFPATMSSLSGLPSTMSSFPPFHSIIHVYFSCFSTPSNHSYPPAFHPTMSTFPRCHSMNYVYVSRVSIPSTMSARTPILPPTVSTRTPFHSVNRVSFVFSCCSSASTTRTRSTCRSTSARGRPAPSAANLRLTRSENTPINKKCTMDGCPNRYSL